MFLSFTCQAIGRTLSLDAVTATSYFQALRLGVSLQSPSINFNQKSEVVINGNPNVAGRIPSKQSRQNRLPGTRHREDHPQVTPQATQQDGISHVMKIENRTFDGSIPTADGESIAELITLEIPMDA